MADENELHDYVAPIAASTAELVAVVDAMKDALIAVLPNEEDCAVAIVGAKETREALIRDTYRIGLTPFMQQTAAGEPDEVMSEEEIAADMDEEEVAADADDVGGARGRR